MSESLKMGTLVDGVPQHVREHLLVNMNEKTWCEDLKTYLLRYEGAQGWIQPTTTDLQRTTDLQKTGNDHGVKLPWT